MIGRIIDKYEILEEVGQGGMSVVYRGRDTVLKRDVAIKVLHQHLASHEEARRRFEREAQAVAKLRHDNILEIFDYSGKGSADSYIVTEFINGHTLKDFVSKHRIAYPEIAAMVVTEMCRALAHAHGLGVLHRDIKPENVMVRDDGRLKLMDFGIAQVIDTARMTVTGQLLGSPAYMSPEHVEGKPLDFRTDIFSLGIVLYQLSTGELPFKGRNPHEILKKIAECRYIDARVVNPLVGDRLGRIIVRALAHDPGDRFPEARELGDDLGRYLAEVEITDTREELGRYFKSPASYEQALRQRLIDALTRRGRSELQARRVSPALELFNRVLTMDPSNETVLHEIDRMSQKRRALRGLALAGGVLVLAGGALGLKLWWPGAAPAARLEPDGALPDATPASPDAMPLATIPDAAALLAPLADAAPLAGPLDAGPRRPVVDAGTRVVRADAAVAGPTRRVRVTTTQCKFAGAWSLDGKPGGQYQGVFFVDLPPGAHVLLVSHPYCFDAQHAVAADFADEAIVVDMQWRPRQVRVVCAGATEIIVDGKALPPDGMMDIPIGNREEKRIKVEYLRPDGVDEKQHTIRPGNTVQEVSCDAS